MSFVGRPVPTLVALTFIICTPQMASGQYTDGRQLAKVASIGVFVSDALDEPDCVANVDTLKTEAELVLRRSGIAVGGERVSHSLVIGIFGFQTSQGLCVVGIDVAVWKFETLLDGSLGCVVPFAADGVFAGAAHNMQDRLRNGVNENTTALANEILKAREL